GRRDRPDARAEQLDPDRVRDPRGVARRGNRLVLAVVLAEQPQRIVPEGRLLVVPAAARAARGERRPAGGRGLAGADEPREAADPHLAQRRTVVDEGVVEDDEVLEIGEGPVVVLLPHQDVERSMARGAATADVLRRLVAEQADEVFLAHRLRVEELAE